MLAESIIKEYEKNLEVQKDLLNKLKTVRKKNGIGFQSAKQVDILICQLI